MDYLDNPRKVYGRVDIIYSDSQISDDIATATNSKAEISHTEEVFKGYLSPTVKACTMDGNATMDENTNYMFEMQISGGGGGAGSNSSKSGGGGGGGAFAFNCVSIVPNMNYRMVLHSTGGGGEVNANGSSGGDSSFELYRNTDYGSSNIYSFWLHGGIGGASGLSATGANQIIKQLGKGKGDKNDGSKK